jgi:aspartyl protease family protein
VSDFPRSLKLVTIWLLIGLAVFLAVRAWQAQQMRPRIEVDGHTIEIRRGADGHYHWPGSVNGQRVDFLIDTGATTTTVPQALADELGLPSHGRVQGRTANGVVVGMLTRADVVLDGGVRLSQLRLVALPALGAPLLGMNVLSRLQWRQAGDRLVIDARMPSAAP